MPSITMRILLAVLWHKIEFLFCVDLFSLFTVVFKYLYDKVPTDIYLAAAEPPKLIIQPRICTQLMMKVFW